MAGAGVLLLKPRIDSARDDKTRQLLSAAAVFWFTLMLRAVAAMVWGVGIGAPKRDVAAAQVAAAAPAAGGGVRWRRPRRD